MITENDVASFVKEETSQSNQETEVELRVCDENLRNEDISELKHTIESSSRIICDALSFLAIKKILKICKMYWINCFVRMKTTQKRF